MTVERAAARPWSAEQRRRWRTFRPERTVLAIARTLTSTIRLIDALSLFRRDTRIEVVFTFDDTTAFHEGVTDLLREIGARTIPWENVGEFDVDLALAASENVDLTKIKAPAVVLPHGIGFHKYVPDSAGPGYRLSGVVPAERLAAGHVWMTTSHPDQREQLRAEHPEAAARCVLVGDPTYDRLVASLRLRDHYRDVLGVRERQRLVVVSSSWGAGSLLGERPALPARLLGELPADEYRAAMVAHPNVWSWHGEFQVNAWLEDAAESGLMRISPTRGWEAAIIASDVVVGDQGSVTLYAAALDRPVLLAAAGGDGLIVPRTPADEIARAADTLRDGPPLRAQVEQAIERHQPGRYAPLTERMFARRGDAVHAMRRFLYERLDLTVPDGTTTLRAVPDPRREVEEPRSYVVFSQMEGQNTVRVRRWPAAVASTAPPEPGTLRHLSVGEDEPDRMLPENASAIVRRRATEGGHEAAQAWIARTLQRHPGAVIAATVVDGGGCLVGLRDGTLVEVAGRRPTDPALCAAAIYTCVRSGRRLAAGPVVVRTGGVETALGLDVRSAD